jgi:type II secretory pathway pseudopilin PulG
MTQTPSEPTAGGTPKQGGVPVFVWVLGGCGCLTVGGFVFLVLLAIALPSFLNQVGKARGSEAQSTLGIVNRAQQAFQLENHSFAKALKDLDVRISPKFFSYEVLPSNSKSEAFTTAIPVSPEGNLKSYTGFIFLLNPSTSEVVTGICETNNPSQTPPEPPLPPTSSGMTVECAPGSSLVPYP